MEKAATRLYLLRSAMQKKNIAAYIIPGTDPHASEYIADHWKEREWISGFNGSAGTIVVTLKKACLWTDSRYFLQSEQRLAGTGITLMKDGLPDTPSIFSWLLDELSKGEKVGVNAEIFSLNTYSSMKSELETGSLQLASVNLLGEIWTDRPALPIDPFFIFAPIYTGKSTKEKIISLREEMQKLRVDAYVLSALDDIAWLFNIRGNDVKYNPVVIAYAMITKEKATLFIQSEKITEENKEYLQNEGVDFKEYSSIYNSIAKLKSEDYVLVDGAKLNQSLFEAIPAGCTIRNAMSPVFKLKSIKNQTETDGIRRAMIKDGVALTRFFYWLEKNINIEHLTERSISVKLYEFRAEQENFKGESFATIAGYGAHGAIVHYSATEESDATLNADSLLLLDSGGQYLDGTTDITRTIALGEPTELQKQDFTRVLKGHIGIATVIFPIRTRGSQIDILARKALWDCQMNYGHGTGHGIGHFLCVHEGPQSIRMEENSTVLEPGMILSNEPGLYRTNQYGIRIENLVRVEEAGQTEFGKFLKFETLTLFPIDLNLIDTDLLNENEINWLNQYHNTVFDSLIPHLTKEEGEWLKNKCTNLSTK